MKNFSKILLLLFVVSVIRGKPVFDNVNWDEEARNSDEAWRGDLENKDSAENSDGGDEQWEEEDWGEKQFHEEENEWGNESSDVKTEQDSDEGENEWEDESGNDDTEQDWNEADDNWEDDEKSWDEEEQGSEWNDEPLTGEKATFGRLEDDILTFKRELEEMEEKLEEVKESID